jgi:hypothetical protein
MAWRRWTRERRSFLRIDQQAAQISIKNQNQEDAMKIKRLALMFTAVVVMALGASTSAHADYLYTYTDVGGLVDVSITSPTLIAQGGYSIYSFPAWNITSGVDPSVHCGSTDVCGFVDTAFAGGAGAGVIDANYDGQITAWSLILNPLGETQHLGTASTPIPIGYDTYANDFGISGTGVNAIQYQGLETGTWTVTPVPLPATAWLMLPCLAGLGTLVCKRVAVDRNLSSSLRCSRVFLNRTKNE